jgi:hypothetical protein
MWYDKQKRAWPNKSFDETPAAYWFYIDSNPLRDATVRSWSLTAPSLERFIQRHFEGLLQRRTKTFDEMLAWFALVQKGSLDCKGITKSFLDTEEWKNQTGKLTDEQVVRALYQALLGIDADTKNITRAVDMKKKSGSWTAVVNDLMQTTAYQDVCSKDWY